MKMKNNKKKKGFTLIELIVVIAILAILAAVAVPNFIGITDSAKTATQVAAAAEYANAINIVNATATGKIVTADISGASTVIGKLSASSILPTTDIPAADLISKVFARITITGGVASVTNKNKI